MNEGCVALLHVHSSTYPLSPKFNVGQRVESLPRAAEFFFPFPAFACAPGHVNIESRGDGGGSLNQVWPQSSMQAFRLQFHVLKEEKSGLINTVNSTSITAPNEM